MCFNASLGVPRPPVRQDDGWVTASRSGTRRRICSCCDAHHPVPQLCGGRTGNTATPPPFTADTSPRLAVLPVAKEKSVRLHSLHVGSIISNRRNIARQAQSAHNIKRDFSVRHIYFVAAHHVAAKHTRTTVPFSYLNPHPCLSHRGQGVTSHAPAAEPFISIHSPNPGTRNHGVVRSSMRLY